jgi:hypothetical protein
MDQNTQATVTDATSPIVTSAGATHETVPVTDATTSPVGTAQSKERLQNAIDAAALLEATADPVIPAPVWVAPDQRPGYCE